jgi:hypothetical protein
MVMLEIVKQLCLFALKQNDWWQYIDDFSNNCLPIDSNFSDCVQVITTRLFKNDPFLNECVSEAFELSEPFNLSNSSHLSTKINYALLEKESNRIYLRGS